VGGTWHIISPLFPNVGGTRPCVPHQIAPMGAILRTDLVHGTSHM